MVWIRPTATLINRYEVSQKEKEQNVKYIWYNIYKCSDVIN